MRSLSLASLAAVSLAALAFAAVSPARVAAGPAAGAVPGKPAVAVAAAPQAPSRGPQTCYELSKDGKTWSKTPEVLCVELGPQSASGQLPATLTLRSGLPMAQVELARMTYSLLERAKCLSCNRDLFGVANPSNSIINELKVKFDGKLDSKTRLESGTVMIGKNRLAYRSTAPTPTLKPAPAPVRAAVPARGAPPRRPASGGR
jgi:hypothetical protein